MTDDKQGGRPKKLSPGMQAAAIAWAADKKGTSYGKLMLKLTEQQKKRIYRDYRKQL